MCFSARIKYLYLNVIEPLKNQKKEQLRNYSLLPTRIQVGSSSLKPKFHHKKTEIALRSAIFSVQNFFC